MKIVALVVWLIFVALFWYSLESTAKARRKQIVEDIIFDCQKATKELEKNVSS